jgi:hypothetical protein
MDNLTNPQLHLAFDFLEYTDKNIFLTGKAGTGKTTFLHNLKKKSMKRMIVVAPTGVAAINAGGVTIHSFFQISFGPQIPGQELSILSTDEPQDQQANREIRKFGRNKIGIIKSMDLLVIDEISMVRADLLDAIDVVLRRYKNRYKPFGGVQLLMIGDLQQLAPVVKDHEWDILKRYYDTAFFFSSSALQKTSYISIELRHIYRQSDDKFISILNKIRDNKLDPDTLHELNRRCIPDISNDAEDGYIILTTHNAQAQKINDTKLQKIKSKAFTYTATIEGEFPEYSYPTEPELFLKKGAQVMFVKNDLSGEKRYYNGKIGKIILISEDQVFVKCEGDPDPILVQEVEWSNVRYALNEATARIEESVAGKFSQYPLKLAWAITIHKSQGLTFEKAIIDANQAFAHGQVYVALSRCKSLEGIILNSPLSGRGIINSSTVSEFNREIEQNPPGEELLAQSKKNYHKILLLELFDFKQIQRQLFYLVKILKEHLGVIQAGTFDDFSQIANQFKTEVTDVSEKFEIQLENLFRQQEKPEDNQILQDRVTKACTYFLEKTDNILQSILDGVVIDHDNKAVRKLYSDAIEKLEDYSRSKHLCLKDCKNEFTISKYLEARARSAVARKTQKESKSKPAEHIAKSIVHPDLYVRLKEWRNNQVANSKLPEYMILPQKTMAELANSLPQSFIALNTIKGMGKKKIASFGKEILAIITKYCLENNLETPPKEIENLSIDKPEKINSKKLSFDMFLDGKSINDIATARSMAVTTIEGHLANFIGTGELKIDQFLDPNKINLISRYFLEKKDYHLGPAKQDLGAEVSYSDLKYMLKHLEYSGMK